MTRTELSVATTHLFAGLDISTAAGVYEALNRTDTDESLYHAITALQDASDVSKQLVLEAFSDICYFYTDSAVHGLKRLAQRTVRRLEGDSFRSRILSKMKGDLTGLELSNLTGTQFALFLPDASEPGRVRFSCFDERGFFGHSTFDTYDEALQSAWKDGFKKECSNMLNSLCATEEWRNGSEFTAMIQQHNLGKANFFSGADNHAGLSLSASPAL